MSKINEDLFTAVDLIVGKRLEEISYDMTKPYIIKEVKGNGEYRVSDTSTSFLAYSENEEYKVDDEVYVLIPNGDFNETKLITGKVKKKGIAEVPYNYVLPEKAIIPVEKFTGPGELSLLANGEDAWRYDKRYEHTMGVNSYGNNRSIWFGVEIPSLPPKPGYFITQIDYKGLEIDEDWENKDIEILGEGILSCGGAYNLEENIDVKSGVGQYINIRKTSNYNNIYTIRWHDLWTNFYYIDENGEPKDFTDFSVRYNECYMFLSLDGILHFEHPYYADYDYIYYFDSINELNFELKAPFQNYPEARKLIEKYKKCQLLYTLNNEDIQYVKEQEIFNTQDVMWDGYFVIQDYFNIDFTENEIKKKQLQKLSKEKQGNFKFFLKLLEPIDEELEEQQIIAIPSYRICKKLNNEFIIDLKNKENVSGYNRLLLSADFKTAFNNLIKNGNYGVLIKLYTEQIPVNNLSETAQDLLDEYNKKIQDLANQLISGEITSEQYENSCEEMRLSYFDKLKDSDELEINDETNQMNYIYTINLDSSNMIGNIYNFLEYSQQQEIFDISQLGPITKIKGIFYQSNNFTRKNEKGEEEELVYDPDLYGIYKNLFANNITLSFGYPSEEITGDNYVQLYTNDNKEYQNVEKRTINLRWIQKINDVWTIREELNENERIEWYKYDPYNEKQVDGWIKLPGENNSILQYVIDTDTTKTVTRLKARVYYDQIEGIDKYIDSPSFEFIHTVPTVDQITLDATTRFTLGVQSGINDKNEPVYDFENNYYLYGLDNQIIDKSYIKQMPLILRDNVDNINYPLYYQQEQEDEIGIFRFTTNSNSELDNSNIEGIIYKSLLNINENAMFTITYDSQSKQLYIQINSVLEQKDNLLVGTLIKDQIQYSFSKEFEFGYLGNTGTKYTILMDLHQYEKNDKKQELLYYPLNKDEAGIDIKVDVRVVNEENKKVDIDNNNIKMSFELKNLVINDDNTISSNSEEKSEPTLGDILKIQIDKMAGLAEHDIIAYFPIPSVNNLNISGVTGATQVIYNSWGIPSYYQGKYKLYKNGIEEKCNWYVGKKTSEGYQYVNIDEATQDSFGPKIVGNQLYPPSAYLDNFEQYYVQAKNNNNELLWSCPLLMMQNKYFSNTLNEWDGNLKINEEENYILAKMFAAGRKDEDNTFSGVVMGDTDIAIYDLETKKAKTKNGLFGFNKGVRTFELNSENGSAFFGGEMNVDDHFLVSDEGITNINHLLIGDSKNGLQISSIATDIALKYKDYINEFANTYIQETETQSDRRNFINDFEESLANDTEFKWVIYDSQLAYIKSKNESSYYQFIQSIDQELQDKLINELNKIFSETIDTITGNKKNNFAYFNGKLYLEQMGHLMFDYQDTPYSLGYQPKKQGLGFYRDSSTPIFLGIRYQGAQNDQESELLNYYDWFNDRGKKDYISRLSPDAWAAYLQYKLNEKSQGSSSGDDYIEMSVGNLSALRVYGDRVTCVYNGEEGTLATMEDIATAAEIKWAENVGDIINGLFSEQTAQTVTNIFETVMNAIASIDWGGIASALASIINAIIGALGNITPSEEENVATANFLMLEEEVSNNNGIQTRSAINSLNLKDIPLELVRYFASQLIINANKDNNSILLDKAGLTIINEQYCSWPDLAKAINFKNEYFKYYSLEELEIKKLEIQQALWETSFDSLGDIKLGEFIISPFNLTNENSIINKIQTKTKELSTKINTDIQNFGNSLESLLGELGENLTLETIGNRLAIYFEKIIGVDINGDNITSNVSGLTEAINKLNQEVFYTENNIQKSNITKLQDQINTINNTTISGLQERIKSLEDLKISEKFETLEADIKALKDIKIEKRIIALEEQDTKFNERVNEQITNLEILSKLESLQAQIDELKNSSSTNEEITEGES